jgi:hypothetical protein
MGTVDDQMVGLECGSCGNSEQTRIIQKGSGWSVSPWRLPAFETFDAEYTSDVSRVYFVKASCKKCGGEVTEREGFAPST